MAHLDGGPIAVAHRQDDDSRRRTVARLVGAQSSPHSPLVARRPQPQLQLRKARFKPCRLGRSGSYSFRFPQLEVRVTGAGVQRTAINVRGWKSLRWFAICEWAVRFDGGARVASWMAEPEPVDPQSTDDSFLRPCLVTNKIQKLFTIFRRSKFYVTCMKYLI